MRVLAPTAGRLVPLAQVPDPVFAGELLGPGLAIEPEAGEVVVASPIDGRLVKAHPHAFVVLADGVGVLVHLGIDTVHLAGRGFEVLAEEGATVAAGEPLVRWDTANVVAPAISNLVPVVVMDRPAGSLALPAPGVVAVGDVMFEVG